MHKRIINDLLRPRTWKAPEERHFFLSASDIQELCESAERIFKEEKTVLELHGGLRSSPADISSLAPHQTLTGNRAWIIAGEGGILAMTRALFADV